MVEVLEVLGVVPREQRYQHLGWWYENITDGNDDGSLFQGHLGQQKQAPGGTGGGSEAQIEEVGFFVALQQALVGYHRYRSLVVHFQ